MEKINIQKLNVQQNTPVKGSDLLQLAYPINALIEASVVPVTYPPPYFPLIASTDVAIPTYTSAIVNQYFFTPINNKLTLEYGSILRIL